MSPTQALADCTPGALPSDIYCSSGDYPTGIFSLGDNLRLTLEDGVNVTNSGVLAASFTGDATVESVATTNFGDLRIFNANGDGVTVASLSGAAILDLTDGDTGDTPGSIDGYAGVRGYGASVELDTGNLTVTSYLSDSFNFMNTGYAIYGEAQGDVTIRADGVLSPRYGIGIGAFTQGGDISIATTENADILAGYADSGVLALGNHNIDITLNGNMGGIVGSMFDLVGTPLLAVSGYYGGPGGDVNVTVNGDINSNGPSNLLGTFGITAVNIGETGNVAVNFGITREAYIQGGGISGGISNAANSGSVDVTLGAGSTAGPISAASAGTGSVNVWLLDGSHVSGVIGAMATGEGDTAVNVGDGVTLGLANTAIWSASTTHAEVNVGEDLALFTDSFGLQRQIAIYAVSTGFDGGSEPSVEVTIGQNAGLTVQDYFSSDSVGVFAYDGFGDGAVHVSIAEGLTMALSGGYDVGILAHTDLGDIDVNLAGGVIGVAGGFFSPPPMFNAQSAGIVAESSGGDIVISSAADINVLNMGGQSTGILATTTDGGGINLTSGGDVQADIDSVTSRGILAQAQDGAVTVIVDGDVAAGYVGVGAHASRDGDVSVTLNGAVDAATGVAASSGRGDVLVATNADSQITSQGFGSGIAAQSGGSVTVLADGNITADGSAVLAIRNVFVSGPGGLGDPPPPVVAGDIDVTVNGDVISSSIIAAIVALNDAEVGSVTLNYGMDGAAQLTSTSAGLLASNTSSDNINDVAVTVGSGGSIAAVRGAAAYNTGSGAASVTTLTGSAIVAEDEAITVTAQGPASASIGGSAVSLSGAAVLLDSGSAATLNVGAGALVQGVTVAAGIEAAGPVTINNAGTIRIEGGDLSSAIFQIDADTVTLNNTGTLTGALDFTSQTTLGLSNAGTWRTSGESAFTAGDDTLANGGLLATRAGTIVDFGAGEDGFTNSGTLLLGDTAGASTLTMVGLESFANDGLILFGSADGLTSDGETNDRLAADGADYVGDGGVLAIDVDLGAGSQDSCAAAVIADCFSLVGGSTGGSTFIRVRDAGDSAGAVNKTGIVLVDVEGGTSAAGDFSLDPASSFYRSDATYGGVLAKGIFIYRLDYDADRQQHRLVSEPDRKVFQFAPLAASAQNIWYAGVEGWFDQQADLRDRGGKPRNGAWLRTIAASSARDFSVPFAAGDISIDVAHSQQTVGVQGGVDFVLNFGGGEVTAGLTLGTLDSDVRFDSGDAHENFEGTSYGAYAGWSGGPVFLNAMTLVNDLDLEHRAGWGPGYGEGHVKSAGVQVEGGWRISLRRMSVLPLASLAWVRTDLDDLLLPGAELRTTEAESLRGSLGARLSGETSVGPSRLRLSATGRFWNEFEGDNRANLIVGADTVQLSDDFGGQFGELGAGFSLIAPGGVAVFFANLNSKFGDEYQSTQGSVGLRMQW